MNCIKYKMNISALLDKELPQQDAQKTLTHMNTCPECREFYDKNLELQNTVKKLAPPRVPVSVKTGLYRRLEQDKTGFGMNHLWHRITGNKWALRLELALVFCVAVLIGMHLKMPGPEQPCKPKFSQNIDEYFVKSSKMLLELKNSDMDPGKMQNEKRLAKQLLVESKLVTENLDASEPHINRLVKELEPVFWDVANLNDPNALKVIRQTIDNRDYLLKLDIARENPMTQAGIVK